MTNVQANTTSHASVISQYAALGALTGVQSVIESLRIQIQNNRDVMMEQLETFTGVHIHKPDGTFYAFPDFRAYNENSVELADFLLKKALVVTVPGKPFGMEGYLRLSYAGNVSDITEGVERIKWALDPESPNEIYIGDRKLIRDWL
jgi:aspartate aminotransferase